MNSLILKMKRIILVVTLLLSFVCAHSNSSNKTDITSDFPETHKQYDKLIDLAKAYFNKNIEYAFNCAYKANAIAEENNDNKKAAECNMIMGDIFKENNSYPTAISYYEKAIENLNVIKDYHTIYKLYIKIAKLYQTSEFDSKWSIDALDNALKYAKNINETEVYNEVNMAYGDFYCAKNECNLAEKHFNEILKNNNKNTIHTISVTLTKKADILIKQKKYNDILVEINEIKNACGDKILKVIIETCLLSEIEKIKMSEVVSLAKAEYIKRKTKPIYKKRQLKFDYIDKQILVCLV